MTHMDWCKGGRSIRTSAFSDAEDDVLGTSLVATNMKSGRIERSQWEYFEPSRPPNAGISSLGSAAIESIMLGNKPSGLLTQSNAETSMVMAGG